MSRVEQLAFKIPKTFCAIEQPNHTSSEEKIKSVTEAPAIAPQEPVTPTVAEAKSENVESLDKPQANRKELQPTIGMQIAVDVESEIDEKSPPVKSMRLAVEIPRRSKALLVEDNKINMKVSFLPRRSVNLLTNQILVNYMKRSNTEYVTAENGLEALQHYVTSPQAFKIIFMGKAFFLFHFLVHILTVS